MYGGTFLTKHSWLMIPSFCHTCENPSRTLEVQIAKYIAATGIYQPKEFNFNNVSIFLLQQMYYETIRIQACLLHSPVERNPLSPRSK